jgi:predicted nuclease of predicted toxin-antitoxin system
MQFLADECCHALIVTALRAAGHDVVHIQETQPGVSDDVVIAAAAADQRILITEDKDFGELVFRQRVTVPGLILLRLTTADPQRKAERLLTAITAHSERLNGQHLVVLDSSVRWRPLLAAI